jgi:hypothetical protein
MASKFQCVNAVENYRSSERRNVLKFSRGLDATRHSDSRTALRQSQQFEGKPLWSSSDRRVARGLAMYMYKNYTPCYGPVYDLNVCSVGTGISLSSLSTNAEFREKADNAFRNWRNVCDVSGKFTFSQFQQFAPYYTHIPGEMFVKMMRSRTGWPGLQLIEPYAISSVGDMDESKAGRNFVDGIFLNNLEKPLKYRQTYRDGSYDDVKASAMIHLGWRDTGDEIRPMTPLIRGLTNMVDLKEINVFEKLAIKIQSALACVIQDAPRSDGGRIFSSRPYTDPATISDPAQAEEQTRLNALDILDGGTIPTLAPGKTIVNLNQNRPGPLFIDYSMQMMREISLAFGVPFEIWFNPSAVSGGMARFLILKMSKACERMQDMINKMNKAVWEFVISCFIDMDILPYVDDWYQMECNGPALLTADMERDRKMDLAELGAGVLSMKDLYGKYGVHNWQSYVTNAAQGMEFFVDQFASRGIEMTKNPLYFPQTLVAAQQMAGRNPTSENTIVPATDETLHALQQQLLAIRV